MEWTEWVMAVVPSLVAGVGLFWLNRKQQKRYEAADEREERRLRGETVQLSLLLADSKLSKATAMALKRGYANGEVEEGLEQYDKAMEDFKKYERELVAKQRMKS
ncbi:MAG: hypothetical protein ACOX7J_03010 [Bacillota bacterium]|jgi:hypothetical protein